MTALRTFNECIAEMDRLRVWDYSPDNVTKAKAVLAEAEPWIADTLLIDGIRGHLNALRRKPDYVDPERPHVPVQDSKAAISARRRRDEARAARAAAASSQLTKAMASLKEVYDKAGAYDKVIKLFDAWTVNGVKLGDCTADHLTTQAARLRTVSTDATAKAALYARIAAQLERGVTVRTSNNRVAILEILETAA